MSTLWNLPDYQYPEERQRRTLGYDDPFTLGLAQNAYQQELAKPQETYQEPVLSRKRKVGGAIASMFGGPVGALGNYLENQPRREAERAYLIRRGESEDRIKNLEKAAEQERLGGIARMQIPREQRFGRESEARIGHLQSQTAMEEQRSRTLGAQENTFRNAGSFQTIVGPEGKQQRIFVPQGDPGNPIPIGQAPPKDFAPGRPVAAGLGQNVYDSNGRLIQRGNPKFATGSRGGGARSEAQRRIFETQHVDRHQKIQLYFNTEKQKLKGQAEELGIPYKQIEPADNALETERAKQLDEEEKRYKDISASLGYTEQLSGEMPDAQGGSEDPGLYRFPDGKLHEWNGQEWVPYEGDEEGQ